MLVSQLTLKNWRNFTHVSVPLSERVFVIGPNASGKSNFLDALRFVRDIAKPGGGLQPALAQRGGLSKVRCLYARQKPDVELVFELKNGGDTPDWKYEIGITQQVRGRRQPILKYERVWNGTEKILDRPDDHDKRDEERRTQTHLEQISANSEFREVSRFFESIRYLHLVPQLLRHPGAFQGLNVHEDPYGRNFLETVAKTSEARRDSRLGTIERVLQEAVPNLKHLKLTKDEAGVPHLEAIYKHWRPNGARQREDQFSDGTLRMIGLFWSLLEGDAPLLLEEPELSLHSEIVKLLPGQLARLQRTKKRQILVSTHSWDLLSNRGISGNEVIILKPGEEGTEAKLASDDPSVRALLTGGLTIAEAALPGTKPAGLGQLQLFE